MKLAATESNKGWYLDSIWARHNGHVLPDRDKQPATKKNHATFKHQELPISTSYTTTFTKCMAAWK